jgi:hypothetical protein
VAESEAIWRISLRREFSLVHSDFSFSSCVKTPNLASNLLADPIFGGVLTLGTQLWDARLSILAAGVPSSSRCRTGFAGKGRPNHVFVTGGVNLF